MEGTIRIDCGTQPLRRRKPRPPDAKVKQRGIVTFLEIDENINETRNVIGLNQTSTEKDPGNLYFKPLPPDKRSKPKIIIREEASQEIERKGETDSESETELTQQHKTQIRTKTIRARFRTYKAKSSKKDTSIESEPNHPNRKEKKQTKLFAAASEIMTSEKAYVNDLKILNEFRKLIEVRLTKDEISIIFSNLSNILDFNSDLLKQFESRIEKWATYPKIADVLVKQGPFLRVYEDYVKNFADAQKMFINLCANNPDLKKDVECFESHPRCRNVKLVHHLLSPVQRSMRYKPLLEAYLKQQEGNSIDLEDSKCALNLLSEIASSGNSRFSLREQYQKIVELQKRLGDFKLIKSSRNLLKESDMVKSGEGEVSIPFHLILVTDSLIYAKYKVTS